MRLRSSCYVQVLLLAVAAIHSNVSAEDSEVVSLDEALGTYAGESLFVCPHHSINAHETAKRQGLTAMRTCHTFRSASVC